jgi:putative phage-type endonuclease
VLSEEERWHARRRELVTASDAAAILGVDRRRGPLAVYAQKVGDTPPPEDLDYFAFGRDVEAAIGKAYQRKTGRPVRELGRFDIRTHPDLPWLGATRDFETHGTEEMPSPAPGPGPLEAKAVAAFKASEWEDDPPVVYQIQVQVQMACTAAQWGALVALVGGISPVWKDLQRDDAFLAAALPQLERFMWHVRNRQPPPEVDATPGTSAALRAIYGKADGSTVLLDAEAMEWADHLERAQVRAKADEADTTLIENKLRRRVGAATWGALPDGSFIVLKTTNVKGHTTTVEPYSYRALRRWRPRLQRRKKT